MNHNKESQERGKNMEEDEVYGYAGQLIFGIVVPVAFQAVLELRIFDIIAKAGPKAKLSAKEIAKQLPTKNPDAATMIDRMLRLLASHCIVECSLDDESQRLYSLTPVTTYFLPNADGVSLVPLLSLNQEKVIMASWSKLKEAVLEGGVPFHRVHGVHVFEYSGIDPKFNQTFNNAMFNVTTLTMKKILECYKGFENLKKLVDVGGGNGICLNLITTKYSSLKGINFDLPHVVQDAPHYQGVEHVGGDMFESVPKGDAILLKSVLHNWNDGHCVKLLKNCYDAIPDEGKVIVIEEVLETMPNTSATERSKLQLDVLMMTQLQNGGERTKQEFLALASTSAFSGINFVCNANNSWVMEFYK